jgi:hypothetical protein
MSRAQINTPQGMILVEGTDGDRDRSSPYLQERGEPNEGHFSTMDLDVSGAMARPR